MNNIYWEIVIFGILFLLGCYFIESRYQKAFDQEMKKCRNEYDCKISKLEDKLKNLSDDYKSLKSDYETLLKRHKDDEENHSKTLTQKYAAERRIADLQNKLYCARKRAKKLTDQFISILAKQLGSNQY